MTADDLSPPTPPALPPPPPPYEPPPARQVPLWPFAIAVGIIGVPLTFCLAMSIRIGDPVGLILYPVPFLLFTVLPTAYLIWEKRRRVKVRGN